MATLKELRDERLRKLTELKELGYVCYPARATRTHKISEVLDKFDDLENHEVTVVGRIATTRKFGKIAFFVLKDASGSMQLFLSENTLSDLDIAKGSLGMKQLNLLDSGDFVQAAGKVIKTKTGEISIEVHELKLLTKSLRPMPTAQDGFTNKEERLRRRYIDTNVNQDVYERYLRRSKFWQSTRDFLLGRDFVEINIPVLEHTTGGADANPFVTHMDALDQDFYLRISHELPLKRLLGGGYEKVFDIGPRFRNENYSDEHLPEHVAMEWYWAYANWQDGMKLTQEMVRYVADKTWGERKFTLLNNQEIDLGNDNTDWPLISFVNVIKDKYNIDVFNTTIEEVSQRLQENKIEVEKTDSIPRGIDKLWKKIRVTLPGPAFLVDVPTFLQPLAKAQEGKPELTEQFNLILGGTEVCKAFSELNDPVDQLNRFLEQQSMRDNGDDEAQMLDIDFVEMLEYGMPPACGYGNSERLFWMLEGVTAREGVVFPQLRREVDDVTRGIYPQVGFDDAMSKRTIKLVELQANTIDSNQQQDFSSRIVTVINKELESWQAGNAIAHMNAIIGNEINKDQLVSGDVFVGADGVKIPRNSQHPIIIMRASDKELHKLYTKITGEKLLHHVFIRDMQETSDDQEIVDRLRSRTISDTEFYGVSFFATHEVADRLVKGLQLWK
jgi:lysyl-tRNA synthetase class 2